MTATIEATCKDLRQVAQDIAEALPEKFVAEFRKRLEEAPAYDADIYFGFLLDGAWKAKNAPTLAQRVTDLKEELFDREPQR